MVIFLIQWRWLAELCHGGRKLTALREMDCLILYKIKVVFQSECWCSQLLLLQNMSLSVFWLWMIIQSESRQWEYDDCLEKLYKITVRQAVLHYLSTVQYWNVFIQFGPNLVVVFIQFQVAPGKNGSNILFIFDEVIFGNVEVSTISIGLINWPWFKISNFKPSAMQIYLL